MAKTGLSILIPIYNCDVTGLVNTIHAEASSLSISYEIRCYDDDSEISFKNSNQKLSNISSVNYKELPENIGRSAIRNKLAQEAIYDFLLFIDSDSTIISNQYLQTYWTQKSLDVVNCGGTVYNNEYSPIYSLRFFYGKKREEKSLEQRIKNPYQNISFNNLLIPKTIFLDILLDETIKTYGHEDSKFASILCQKKIKVIPIKNPVQHVGLEINEQFLDKSKVAIKNFYKITQEGHCHETKLYRSFAFLKKWRLAGLALRIFNLTKGGIEKNLISAQPSILLFDLYKLHQLLLIDRKIN